MSENKVINVTEARIRESTYTGDGADGGQTISLGFRPKRIEIRSDDGNTLWIKDGDDNTKLHYTSFGGAMQFGTHPTAITITDTGFTVDSSYANKNGVCYTYKVVMN